MHIVEIRLTLHAYADIPITYWDHSFTTSIYHINRSPTKTLTKFIYPFHALHNTLPDY